MKPVVVIGLGSPLMSDEGVGIHVLHALEKHFAKTRRVEFLDLGTAGARVLHAIANRNKAVIIDCAFMDKKPGTILRFTPHDVTSRKVEPRMSLHGGDLLDTIALSRAIGEAPGNIVIFGIEPAEVSQGEKLSKALAVRLSEYVDTVAAEIEKE
jgi:hydrogenase maturation protease